MADTMGTYEAHQLWGYPQDTIRRWCREGKIPGATHDFSGSTWHIPKDAKCPAAIKNKEEDTKYE